MTSAVVNPIKPTAAGSGGRYAGEIDAILDREAPTLREFNMKAVLFAWRLSRESPAAAAFITRLPRREIDKISQMTESEILTHTSETLLVYHPGMITPRTPKNHQITIARATRHMYTLFAMHDQAG